MRHSIPLLFALIVTWLVWSGHYDNYFILALGLLSCLGSVFVCKRMLIVDSEGAPSQLGLIRPLIYLPWLMKEIVISNLEITKIILSKKMPLQRNFIEVGAHQKSELGRVMLANSITLTPGTVSCHLTGDRILIHALSFEGAEEDLSGEMDRRVCWLDGTTDDTDFVRSMDSSEEGR